MGAGTRENINVEKTLGEQLLENLKDLKEQSFNDIKEETLRYRKILFSKIVFYHTKITG